VAVIEELRRLKSDIKISYIGSKNGMERKIIEDINVQYSWIFCGKLRRYFSWQNFLDFLKVPLGIFQSVYYLIKMKPDLIFSKGGSVSLPVTIAGFILRKPVYIHESDTAPGLANKISFFFADKILLSFDETKNNLKEKYKKKSLVVGNPVRLDILDGSREKGLKFCGFAGEKDVLMILGGSQGAMQINKLIWDNIDDILKNFDIVHQAGKGNLNLLVKRKNYKQVEFLGEEIRDVYKISDVIISRAGANSLAEIEILNKKALIIPLEFASRGDQVHNAEVYGKYENFIVMSGEINEKDFLNNLLKLKNLKVEKNTNIKNATVEIAKLILSKK